MHKTKERLPAVEREQNSEGFSSIGELQEAFTEILHSMTIEKELPQVELNHLKGEVKENVRRLIDDYGSDVRKPSPIEMKLILTNEVPVFQRPRRIPLADQCLVERQVEEWLADNIIKVSTSEYTSPIVLVPKKDGTKRLRCDYQKLNEKVLRDKFPMPLIDNVLQKLQSEWIFPRSGGTRIA